MSGGTLLDKFDFLRLPWGALAFGRGRDPVVCPVSRQDSPLHGEEARRLGSKPNSECGCPVEPRAEIAHGLCGGVLWVLGPQPGEDALPQGPGEGEQFLDVVFRRTTDVFVLNAVPLGPARIGIRRVTFAILT